jgi:hypothetical protein
MELMVWWRIPCFAIGETRSRIKHVADVQLTPDGVQDQIVERATDLAPYRPGPPSPCFA